MIRITRKELANLGKVYREEDKTKSYIKEIVKVDNDFTNTKIISTKIEENVYMSVIESLAKKDFIVSGKSNCKVLKITAMLEGEFKKINNITKEEFVYKQNSIVIEYLTKEDTSVIQKKSNTIKYLHISLMEEYLSENDFLYDSLKNSANENFLVELSEPNIKNLYQELFDRNYKGMIDKIYLKNKTMDLIFYALNNFSKKEKTFDFLNDEDIKRIKQAKKIMEEQFQEKITIALLSKKVAINEYKLKKGFKELFNTTIHLYLKKLRLNKAVEYLRTKEYSIKEVSQMVGYSSQSSFTYAFSKEYEILPRDLLK